MMSDDETHVISLEWPHNILKELKGGNDSYFLLLENNRISSALFAPSAPLCAGSKHFYYKDNIL